MEIKKIFYILLLPVIISSCGYEIPSPPSIPAPILQPIEKKEESEVIFNYKVSNLRDPFTPAIGEAMISEGAVLNLEILKLSGITYSLNQSIAILSDASGSSYILKDGRLFNDRQEIIKGVSGIIKKNKVILISSDGKIKEFIPEEKI